MSFFLQGLTLGLAYIAPIGMQNMFIINSALNKYAATGFFNGPHRPFFRCDLILVLFLRHRPGHGTLS